MGDTKLHHITGTANVGGSAGGSIRSVTLTPAAALSTLVIRESGSGGTIIASLQAAASGNSAQVRFDGAAYSGQLHATLVGASAVAVIELG